MMRKYPEEEQIFCLENNRQAMVLFPLDLTLAEIGHISSVLTDYVVKAKHDNIQQRREDSGNDQRASGAD